MTRRDAPGQAEGPTAGASWHPPSLVPVASARGGGPPSRGGGGAVGAGQPAQTGGGRPLGPPAGGQLPVGGGGRRAGGRGRRVGSVTWAAALTSRRRGTWHPNHDGATRRVQPRQSTVDPWAGLKVFDTPKLASWFGPGTGGPPPGPRRALGPGPCHGRWHAGREGQPGPQSGGGVET
jgi:hypothetical protein